MILTVRRTRVAVVVGTICMLVMLSAVPSGLSSSAEAADYYRIIVGAAQKPDTLNVFAMSLSISYSINFLVYDTLNSVERDLSFGPQLAQTWETDSTGTLWTFHLVEDAVWHDGIPVTAEDVNFTFNLIMNNRVDAALWVDYLNDVVRVEAVGDHTVEIETLVPKATMLSMMVPILPKHVWDPIPEAEIDEVDPWNSEYFPSGPIGSGPLKLESWDSTKGVIVMLKNPDYFIDTVNVDEVMFKTYGTESVMVSALWAGEIDVAMDVPARLWDETLIRTELGGNVTSALSFYELGINCASAEWREAFPQASVNLETTNLSVRQAIAMATEKDYMVSTILKGFAEPGESIIPTATPFWHYNVTPEERWDYDLAGASALLDAAGYQDLDADGTRENVTSGVELQFSLYYRKDYTDEENCAKRIKDSLASIGIGVQLLEVPEMNLWMAWMNCEYDLFIWGWDTDVDPNFMLSTFTEALYPVDPHDSNKWGDAFWVNETYEALYVEQQRATNATERQAIVHEMQRILYEQCPYVVLYYPRGLHAYNIQEWTNFPRMDREPGATPGTMWFFFDVMPVGFVDTSPRDVDAGPDQSCVVGETLPFHGEAYDPDDLATDLTWTWSFDEPGDTIGVRYGRDVTYTFSNVGIVTVTLSVTDPDRQTDSDTLFVEVSEMSATDGWLKGVVKDQFSDPVVGATVNASGEMRFTDENGNYSMVVEEGDYSVIVSKKGYENVSGEFTVVAGEITWANLTMQLTSGTVEGHVYDAETGNPVDSATITISYGSVVLPVFITNSEGFYHFDYVQMGDINVSAKKSGYGDNATTALVQAGQVTTLDIQLSPVDEGGGIGTLAMIAAGAAVAIAALLVVFYLMRKKNKAAEVPPPPSD